MRIAFISANREKLPDAVIPLGILSVMAATPSSHEKLFWDLCFEPQPMEAVARNLRESQPDIVAIGLRNLQNMDYTNITTSLDAYRDLVRTVRANSPASFILGTTGETLDHVERGLRFDPRTFDVLRKYDMRGPLWQHLDRLAIH